MSKMVPTIQEWAHKQWMRGNPLSEEVRFLRRTQKIVEQLSKSGVPHEIQVPAFNLSYRLKLWLEESGEL